MDQPRFDYSISNGKTSSIATIADDLLSDGVAQLRAKLTAALETIAILRAEKGSLERDVNELRESNADLVDELDLYARAAKNPKISLANFRMFFSLVSVYRKDGILSGNRVAIQVHEIREGAGWVSERQATNFVNDMRENGSFLEYDAGIYDRKSNTRMGAIVSDPGIINYPEAWKESERAKKAKKDEKERREEARRQVLVLQCEICQSTDIEYSLHPTCKICHHQHQITEHVPVSILEIKPDEAKTAGVLEENGQEIAESEADMAFEKELAGMDQAAKPPAPRDNCALCEGEGRANVRKWVWVPGEGDYCCLVCYSSHGQTMRERARLKKQIFSSKLKG